MLATKGRCWAIAATLPLWPSSLQHRFLLWIICIRIIKFRHKYTLVLPFTVFVWFVFSGSTQQRFVWGITIRVETACIYTTWCDSHDNRPVSQYAWSQNQTDVLILYQTVHYTTHIAFKDFIARVKLLYLQNKL